MQPHIIGIDISKSDFHAFINDKSFSFTNDKKGIKRFISMLEQTSICVMESTSTYGYKLVDELTKNSFTVYVVNPLQIKHFVKMGLSKAKTDKIDAIQITKFARIALDDLRPYFSASQELEESKQMITVIDKLKGHKTALTNQLEALNHLPRPSKTLIKSLNKLVSDLEDEIEKLEKESETLVKKDNQQMLDNIQSINGVGTKTAVALIATTKGFRDFTSAKQLSSYFGCCPRVIESGSSVKMKSVISKIGLSAIRTKLYMCALSASRNNKACQSLYQRLITKGKAKRLALLAVVNKLIKQIWAVVSKNQKFDNCYKVELAF